MYVLAPRTGAKSQQFTYDSGDRLVPVLARYDKTKDYKESDRFAPNWSRDMKLKESDNGQIKATASKSTKRPSGTCTILILTVLVVM